MCLLCNYHYHEQNSILRTICVVFDQPRMQQRALCTLNKRGMEMWWKQTCQMFHTSKISNFFFVLPEKNTFIRTSLQYKLEWRMFYSSILDKLSIKSKSSYFAKTFCNSGLNSTNYTESLIFRVNSRKFYTSTACDARDKFHVWMWNTGEAMSHIWPNWRFFL